MPRELDLLFGVICPDCGKLITIVVKGTPKDATALVSHGGKPCVPAPPRTPIVTSENITVKEYEITQKGLEKKRRYGPSEKGKEKRRALGTHREATK